MPDLLPNRDTVAAFEARLGPKKMTVLIWLMALALAIGSLGVIFTGLRAAFNPIRPWLPSFGSSTTLAILQWAATFLPIGFGIVVAWRLQRIQKNYQDFKVKVSGFNQDLITVGQNLESRVDNHDEILKDLLRRFDYVEGKVGGELQDILVRQYLESRGFLVRDSSGQLVPNPLTQSKK